MAWLRIDDAALLNPKLGELTDAELRALLALWSYCARRRNGGTFKLGEERHALYATPKGARSPSSAHVRRFLELELLETDDGELLRVRDWEKYQPQDPTAADRQRAYRERLRAGVDGVVKQG